MELLTSSNRSIRGIKALSMSLATSLKVVQTLPDCKNLTEFQAAFFRYITSLIKCAYDESTSDHFFALKVIVGHGLQEDTLMRFLRELLTGVRTVQQHGHRSEGALVLPTVLYETDPP